MQDSIEDYIRISRNTKQPTQPEISKEVLLTLQRKKQCESYAQRVVEFLMDGILRPEAFVKLLNFINPEHYQDVVEERAVNKFCGYALCGKMLPVMPSKQFHISTKLNKIYDITERKNFCSNYCYQASCYIKDQIETSPLWLRKEDEYTEFKLLDNNESVEPGIEIDHGFVKLKEEPTFTSISSFTEACLDEAQEIENVDPDSYDVPEFEENVLPEQLKSILKKSGKNNGKGVKVSTKYDVKNVDEMKREEIVLEDSLKKKKVFKKSPLDVKKKGENNDAHGNRREEIEVDGKDGEIIDDHKKTIRFEKLQKSTVEEIDAEEMERNINKDNENTEKQTKEILCNSLDNKENKKDLDVKMVNEEKEDKAENILGDKIKKKVKFEKDILDKLRDMPSTSKVKPDELEDLNKSIENICKTMNIKLTTTTQNNTYNPPLSKKNLDIIEDRLKPIEVDTKKMEKIISQVKASEKHKQKKPILIDTTVNPESYKNREKIMISVEGDKKKKDMIQDIKEEDKKNVRRKVIVVGGEDSLENLPQAPKYTKKLVEKIKPPQEDEAVKQIIEKVKGLEITKQKSPDDKLQQVLQKLKSKESKPKVPILITPKINPEITKAKKPITLKLNPVIRQQNSTQVPDLISIKTSILRWITIDTYIFLYSVEKIKEILNEQTLTEYFDKLKIVELQTSQQLKYMNICKKLQLKELAEEQFDNALLGTEFKPPPDYERLKEESKEMKLKIKAYYIGTMYEDKNGNGTNKNGEGEEEGSPAVLPLVDAASTNAMRKKIFINAISKYVLNHIHELNLEDCVLIEVQSMIKTFRLEANNVVFKPQAWNIIAFILILMFSLKNEDLRKNLEDPFVEEYKNRLFKMHEKWTETLKEIFSVLENVEQYVKHYITVENN